MQQRACPCDRLPLIILSDIAYHKIDNQALKNMYFVSLTRLRLRKFIFLPSFFLANEGAIKQLKGAAGFVKGFELVDKGLTFWTVTFWNSPEAMKGFRNTGAHQLAMRKLPSWCDEASYTHWQQDQPDIPDWSFMHAHLIREGRVTKVKFPSPRQVTKSYPPPAWSKSMRAMYPR